MGPSLPLAPFSASAVNVGDKVVVADEWDGAWPYKIQVYDGQTDAWAVVQSSSNPSVPIGSWAGIAAVGSKVLIAGGAFGGCGFICPSDAVMIYDDATGSLSSGPPLSVARRECQAATVGAKVLFGSWDSSTLDVYDDATGVWSVVSSSLPGAESITSIGSRAFISSGSSIEVYDDATGAWTAMSLPTVAWASESVSTGSKAVFASPFLREVDVYDGSTGTWWSTLMPTARQFSAMVAVGSKVLFAGGSPSVAESRVDILDTATGRWSVGALPTERRSLTGAVLGTRAFFCPGPRSYGMDSIVEIYDDAIGSPYCAAAAPNSTGSPARITAQGFPGAAVQGYALLRATGLPSHSVGYFLNSLSAGFTANPGGSQGHLCLGGAIGRYAGSLFDSGSDGVAALQLELARTPTPSGLEMIAAGETWYFQAWYRDTNPGPTSNFTDAVVVTFQ